MKKFNLIITVLVLIFSFLISNNVEAQEINKKGIAKIEIQTSAQCGMCKDAIEKAMAYEKGVKKSTLDLETKIVTVWYKTKRTNPKTIREAISAIGYDADDVLADKKAYEALPACCKKGGHDHH